MKTFRINLSEQVRNLLKGTRATVKAVKTETRKAYGKTAQTIRDIESGKLEVVATLTVRKKK